MSPVDTTTIPPAASGLERDASTHLRKSSPGPSARTSGQRHTPETVFVGKPETTFLGTPASPQSDMDVLKPDAERKRERFIPVTRFALMDRLTTPQAWPPGEAAAARRFFRYLDYWRTQQYAAKLLTLEQAYEPVNPDSDLLLTRKFTDDELRRMQRRLIDGVTSVLEQANFERIDPRIINEVFSGETHYGLDLQVDLSLFEECLVYYRGASTRKDQRRTLRKFLRKEEYEVPIFQRLFVLFKLKPLEVRIREILETEKVSRKEAERLAKRQRAHLPPIVTASNIYMKLFKNMPRSDIEMIFPNTVVKYRTLDKIRLGITSSAGLGMTAAASAGKLALVATNPVLAAGAAIGIGGAIFRQAMNFVNTRQRYMVVLAQNLYFHSMGDNRGVLIKLVNRAAEEDVKEEILLYSVLAKETAHRSDLKSIDFAIEQYLNATFGVEVDFDLEDALGRLMAEGLVSQDANGYLHALPPRDAAEHIDRKWDVFLDDLPDLCNSEGIETGGATAISLRTA